MYKYLILVVTFFVVGGAAYYFNSSGGSDLIVQAITQGESGSNGVSYAQVFSGTYECDETSGCDSPIHLILEEDETFTLNQKNEEGDTLLANGTWGIAKKGGLILLLKKPVVAVKNYPASITANKIDTLTITEFQKKKLVSFPSMKEPVFARIAN